jgi:hypothetical protein
MINPGAVRREFLGVLRFENICKLRILYRDRSRRVGGGDGVDLGVGRRGELRDVDDAIQKDFVLLGIDGLRREDARETFLRGRRR